MLRVAARTRFDLAEEKEAESFGLLLASKCRTWLAGSRCAGRCSGTIWPAGSGHPWGTAGRRADALPGGGSGRLSVVGGKLVVRHPYRAGARGDPRRRPGESRPMPTAVLTDRERTAVQAYLRLLHTVRAAFGGQFGPAGAEHPWCRPPSWPRRSRRWRRRGWRATRRSSSGCCRLVPGADEVLARCAGAG